MIDPLKRARLKSNEDEAHETAGLKKQRERNQRLTQILKTKDRELAAKEKTIQNLQLELAAQKQEREQLSAQLAEKNKLLAQSRKQAEEYKAEAEQYREKAMLSDQYRQVIWNMTVQFGALADHIERQNLDYGKLCKNLYRDLQYALGHRRSHGEWDELRRELRQTLISFFENRSGEDEISQIPQIPPISPLWSVDLEGKRQKTVLQEAVCPDRVFRLLAEKLLIYMERDQGKQLPELLEACGIQVLFYGDAAEEQRNSTFFGSFETGMELPTLVGRTLSEGELQVLARGAHVIGAE